MANSTRTLQTTPNIETFPGGNVEAVPPAPFQTGGLVPPVPPVPPGLPDSDYGIIRLRALEGYTRNHSGNPITGYDLGGVDAVFSNIVAYLYPGDASDDNDLQFECPVPQDMDLLDPQLSVILHFLIPEPPYTNAPIPGGLPIGCEDSIIIYRSGSWVARKLVFDASGDLVSSSGEPVTVPC